MASWLYQLSTDLWSPERYRLEIWEGERWNWSVGAKPKKEPLPKPGDIVAFFYAPSGGTDPGFYGWAIVLEWYPDSNAPLYFRPVAPSDRLKMDPWWDDEAKTVADRIRGPMKQSTLWPISDKDALAIRRGIARWLNRSQKVK